MKNYSPEYTNFYDANYPFSVKVERLFSENDIRGIYRDYYGENTTLKITESTPYDLSKGLASGPFNSPMRRMEGKTLLGFDGW